jgi:ATP-binding cassette, subfamily B, bacterial
MRNGGPALADATRRESAHLVLLCDRGSYAEQNADALARHAERLLAGILRQLKLPGEILTRPRKITVHAQEAIHDPDRPGQVLAVGSSSDPVEDVVYTVYRPESPAVDLAEHLARVVLRRVAADISTTDELHDGRTGSVEAQRFFIEGVARYLVHRPRGRSDQDTSTPTLTAEQVCFDEAAKSKWRLPLYESILRGPAAAGDPALYAAMQEAFGGYLFEREGPKEFLRFLAGIRRDPNYSAEVIYGKSLELLEAEWLSGLRRGIGRKLVSLVGFIRQVYPYLRPYPWRQVELLALMLISSISVQVTPFQFRNLVDLLGSGQTRADPWGYALPEAIYILVVIFLAQAVNITSIARLVYVVQVLGQNILRDLRLSYIDRVNGLAAGYFARTRTGDLMARFTSDMANLSTPLAQTVAYSLYYIILICVTLVSMIIMSWQLTLVLLIIIPIYITVSRWLGPVIQRARRGRQERLAQINSHIEEMIYAHPMIQIFNLQPQVRRRMYPEIHEFRRIEIRSDFLRAIFEEVNDIVDAIQTKIVLLAGTILVLATYDPAVAAVIGSVSVGTVVGFNGLMSRFILPIHRLANIYASVAVAGAYLRRIEEVLQQEPERMDVPENGTAAPPAVREGIAIERIDFAYGLAPTLQDVSVEIPAGTSAAFVGPTGAGKTTLVNMIPRFYDPASGVVKIDGRDVREYSLPALRGQIALVSQENFLFNMTIRENIAMGKPDATDEEIVAAAKKAHIHDFIMTLPAGYDTIVGERGTRLSGGQRQRLAIARALLRDAPILILDEATSALDAETEHEILQELTEATRGKTTISITHRLALAMRADRIYVLDKGRIVESGSHDELMAHGGLYKKLFEDQNQFLLETGADARTSLAVHRLQAVPLFSMLRSADLEPLARKMVIEQYEPGAEICREGEEADKLYVLAQGQVELLARDAAGVEHRLNVLSDNGVFGDTTVLLDVPRQVTARALTPVTVHVLLKGDVELFMAKSQPVAANGAARPAAVGAGDGSPTG